MQTWVSPTVRDNVVEFVQHYSEKTGLSRFSLVAQIGIGRDKFYDWRRRRGRTNDHNTTVPRDFWLQEWERQAILDFHSQHPEEGYRRLAFMMLDADVVAASPSSVYRVLKEADRIHPSTAKPSHKGTGFKQPSKPHKHWHVDVSYLNICGTFYYFCGLLDGCSRYLVHWEIRESMKEADIEIIIQRAREEFPEAHPRIISDNGPQFIARDFKEFVRLCGMTHVRTSPFYPQSNGKIERFHQSLKRECIRPKTPLSLEQARRVVTGFVDQYNNQRLHSAIGYLTPKDKLEGRAGVIFAQRRRKLQQAKENRKFAATACLTEAAA
jgi:transposase InsO family protein